MSERPQDQNVEPIMDEETTKIGLLMETAHTHQTLAENALAKLRGHTQNLDDIVREAIRQTLIDELQAISVESRRASQALQGVQRAANLRVLLWSIGIPAVCCLIACAVAWQLLPSRARIEALVRQRDEMTAAIERLEQYGGQIDLRRCGDDATASADVARVGKSAGGRLCVRVDREAPAYGEHGDYRVVKGP